MVSIKPGVSIRGARPEIILAIQIVADYLREKGKDLVVTSLSEGKHSSGSLHYVGQAFDFRDPDLGAIISELRLRLGAEFDIVDEKTHIHVEFQPKVQCQ